MKKIFKGFVNGKKFTKKSEFEKALQEALKNDEDLNVKSYYEKSSGNTKELKHTIDDFESLFSDLNSLLKCYTNLNRNYIPLICM